MRILAATTPELAGGETSKFYVLCRNKYCDQIIISLILLFLVGSQVNANQLQWNLDYLNYLGGRGVHIIE